MITGLMIILSFGMVAFLAIAIYAASIIRQLENENEELKQKLGRS